MADLSEFGYGRVYDLTEEQRQDYASSYTDYTKKTKELKEETKKEVKGILSDSDTIETSSDRDWVWPEGLSDD